jgi:hypothetical protein
MNTVLPELPRAAESAPKVHLLSFVVPATRDSCESLRVLYDAIREEAGKVADNWEILFVHHGVEESTRRAIDELCEMDPSRVFALRAECSERSDALALGYREARGQLVFTLEPDQDNDLHEIVPFLGKLCRGPLPDGTASFGDRWQKIMPRGVLQRMRRTSMLRSAQAPLTMLLPV